MPGTLYIVATPLGNLEDLSPRALRFLREVERIACEDTRRTRRLLDRFHVKTRTMSCHRFNERARLDGVLRILLDGGDVALVSDGGTPGVSDPGALLVRAALEEGIRVSPVPGPSAPVALLSASGISADRVLLAGFLPHRAGERRRHLRELRSLVHPVVVFEAPHRIRDALRDMAEVLGSRPVVLGRELTKIHETIVRGTSKDILEALGDDDVRGEITMVIAGAEEGESYGEQDREAGRIESVWKETLAAAEGDRRLALREAARRLGLKRSELQRRLAELGEP